MQSQFMHGAQIFGKNSHIKPPHEPEKALKRILDRQKQSQTQFVGNHLSPSRLCLLVTRRGVAPDSTFVGKTLQVF